MCVADPACLKLAKTIDDDDDDDIKRIPMTPLGKFLNFVARLIFIILN